MAKLTRPGARPRSGGKLALFEVIQAAQDGGGLDADAAPLARADSGVATRVEPTAAGPVLPRLRPAGVPADEAPTPKRREPSRRASADPTRDGGASRVFLVALSAVAAVAVLGAVFFLGRLFADKPAQVAAQTPPNPAVLDVGGNGNGLPGVRPRVALDGQTLASPATVTQVVPRVGTAPINPPAARDGGVRRTFGQNYVLIESYDAAEEDRAAATVKALLDNGIEASIERDIPGWGRRLCIVGTVGFEGIRGNDRLRGYLEDLDRVSQTASKDRLVKKFNPQAILWSKK